MSTTFETAKPVLFKMVLNYTPSLQNIHFMVKLHIFITLLAMIDTHT